MSRPLSRIRDAPLNVLPPMARWRCCRCRNGRCSLVWCHPLDQRDEVLSWSDAQFCYALQAAFGWRLGRITQAGKRSAYPLALTAAAKAFTHRTVVVGMRRRRCILSAGQGFNLGLRDVMRSGGNAGRGTECGARILAPGTCYRAISSVVRLTGIRRLA
nr:2-octaprenyl-6-methoxyphenol hydroxylase [Salmonella sp. NCTC 7297]